MKIVILAGGTGTRLWPLSRKKQPKQLTALVTEQTMIRDTVDRFLGDFSKDDIYFSTTTTLEEPIKEEFPGFPEDHFIIEPEKRDSGPAMGFVAAYLSRIAPDEPVAFIPCDHYIHDNELFIKGIKRAGEIIAETGKMMDIAITPHFPSTALGYTHVGKKVDDKDGINIFEFKGHKEKPDLKTAKELLASKEYLWHANFYMWTPKKFLEAYKAYAPDMHAQLEIIIQAMDAGDKTKVAEAFGKMEKISIDYAITEKMNPEDVLIIEGTFGWSDIGAWDVLYEQLEDQRDDNKNLARGTVELYDSTSNVIYNMNTKKKLVAAIGLQDMVIVDTEDALLVCPQDRSQDVKKLLEQLEEGENSQYL